MATNDPNRLAFKSETVQVDYINDGISQGFQQEICSMNGVGANVAQEMFRSGQSRGGRGAGM